MQIMAHRCTKEELDEQFEEFLKEVCFRTKIDRTLLNSLELLL